jgi:ribosomal protein L16 Arg81 hydroxylase
MNEIAKTTDLMAVISQVAMNPEADIEKMDRLLKMKERLDSQAAEMKANKAMVKAQREMSPVATDAMNAQTRSKYASYAALDKDLRPIYTKHGFSLSFDTTQTDPGWVTVVCHVAHSGGHSRTHQVTLPADGIGAKGSPVMTKTHAAGSAMSYGMRYLLKLIFNVAVDDDDGNRAGQTKTITQEQADELANRIDDNRIPRDRFEAWMKRALKVDSIADLNPNGLKTANTQVDAIIKSGKYKV